MDITGVKLKTETRYLDGESVYNAMENLLVIEIQLPGGRAVYEIPIAIDQRDSIEAAITLANKSK